MLRQIRRGRRGNINSEKAVLKQEEKRMLWNDRWGDPDFEPRWVLTEFPVYVQELIDSKTIPSGASILDIGCGAGFLSTELAKKGFDVLGFDFAETAIERAKKIDTDSQLKLEFITADATDKIPVERKFEVAIDRGTMHAIPLRSHYDYIQSISDAVSPGGLLVLIYADDKAQKLINSGEAGSESARETFASIFDPYFKLEDIAEVMIEDVKGRDKEAYRVLLRKPAE